MDPFVIIALIFVLLAFICVVIALVFMGKIRNEQKNAPIVRVEAKLLRLYTQTKVVNKNFSNETVDRAGGYEMTTYFVEFKPKNEKKIVFNLKKKLWLTLHEQEQGFLTYKGYKFMGFEANKLLQDDMEHTYFKSTELKGVKMIDFYGESTHLNFSISSDEKIRINDRGLKRLVNDLKLDKSDWFFVISKDENDYMQVEKEGTSKVKITQSQDEEEVILELEALYDEIRQYMDVAV